MEEGGHHPDAQPIGHQCIEDRLPVILEVTAVAVFPIRYPGAPGAPPLEGQLEGKGASADAEGSVFGLKIPVVQVVAASQGHQEMVRGGVAQPQSHEDRSIQAEERLPAVGDRRLEPV